MENNLENLKYISFDKAMRKLGQTQYTSMFVNPHDKLREDGTPYFEDIRIQGNPDNYYDLKIHQDDVRKFIEQWIEYKKQNNPSFNDKKVEDFL